MTDEQQLTNETPSKEHTNIAMGCHLLALAGFVVPLGNVIGPLVLWQVKKDESGFVDDQGKEAVNFNITIAIAGFVAFVLTFLFIGFILLPVIGIFWLVMTIIAAMKASEGQTYRYPFTLRLIK